MAYVSSNNLERWKNSSVLVTGASSGIGAAICVNLARSGVNVFGCARNVDKIEALSEGLVSERITGHLTALKCDLSNEHEIVKMFQTISMKGGVDVLVNNAGMGIYGSLLSGITSDWEAMWNVNVRAVCICTREFVTGLKNRGLDKGHVIHIGSISGHLLPPARANGTSTYFYGATKSALLAIAEGQRREAKIVCKDLRVSCVSPGLVQTNFAEKALGDPSVAAQLYSSVPNLKPEDIADAVNYILGAPDHVDVNDVLIRPTLQKF